MFPIAEAIYLFHSQPAKVLEWVNIHLIFSINAQSPFPLEVRETLRDILLEVLSDKRRFDFSNEHLDYIISEIPNIELDEYNQYKGAAVPTVYKFFNAVKSDGEIIVGVDKILEANLRILGVLMTEKEAQRKYVNEHFDNSDFREVINEKFGYPKKRIQPKTTIIESYKWLNEPDTELPELYKKMVGLFIHSETSEEQFMDVFSGQPIKNITPIKWHEDNVSELLYFIINLSETYNIEKKKRTDYKKLTACFVKPNGEPFDAKFKELKQKLEYNLSKDKQKAIDELLSHFI